MAVDPSAEVPAERSSMTLTVDCKLQGACLVLPRPEGACLCRINVVDQPTINDSADHCVPRGFAVAREGSFTVPSDPPHEDSCRALRYACGHDREILAGALRAHGDREDIELEGNLRDPLAGWVTAWTAPRRATRDRVDGIIPVG